MTFCQHRETVTDGWCIRRLSQFTEVFYNNPHYKQKDEDLPYIGRYQRVDIQLYPILLNADKTDTVARKYSLL
jgi:hypothetical protein